MSETTWAADNVERWPLDKLIPYARNARTHSAAQVDQLAASMRQWGWASRVLIDESGNVIAGHGRLLAAKKLVASGDERFALVPVMIARGWSDAQRRAYVLADNKLAELAGWDDELLALELQELHAADFDLHVVGFDDDEIGDALKHSDDDEETDSELPAPYSDDEIVELAFQHYREKGFPYPSMPLHERMLEVNRLARTPTDALRHSIVGYHVPDVYHPARFTTPIPNRNTPIEAFESDEKLRIALRLCVEMFGGKINDANLRNACSWVRNAQCAAQFRPAFALYYLRKFCPDGGTWLDTSIGWGGRLVGFAASQIGRYIGIDPSSAAVAGNRRMAEDLRVADRVTLIQKPAEDVSASEVGGKGSVDFCFTSPPYFAKEQYADEPTQSFKRYKTSNAWRDGFLLPTMRLQFAALKRGAHAIVNIADVKIGNEVVPLAEWTIEAGKAAGFEYLRTESFPIPRAPGAGDRPERGEPCIVFTK